MLPTGDQQRVSLALECQAAMLDRRERPVLAASPDADGGQVTALHLWWIRLDEVSRLWLECLPFFVAVVLGWWWCVVGQFRPRR